jgi:putative peptidoglycan lipid II flippase
MLAPTSTSAFLGYAGAAVDLAFASTASEVAAVPAVFNAWLLLSLPISLLGKAIGQSAFPHLASAAVTRDWNGLRRLLMRSTGLAVGLGILAVLVLLAVGRPLIRMLFEHGQFDANAGNMTYLVLTGYALGLPAYCGTELVVRGMLALGHARIPLLIDVAQLIARAGCMWLLIGHLGVMAVPWSFAATSSIEFAVLLVVLLPAIGKKVHELAPTHLRS